MLKRSLLSLQKYNKIKEKIGYTGFEKGQLRNQTVSKGQNPAKNPQRPTPMLGVIHKARFILKKDMVPLYKPKVGLDTFLLKPYVSNTPLRDLPDEMKPPRHIKKSKRKTEIQ